MSNGASATTTTGGLASTDDAPRRRPPPPPPSSLLSATVKAGASNRYDFPLRPDRMALLVVDVQDHLSAPKDDGESSSYLHDVALPKAVANIRELVDAVRSVRDGGDDGGGGGGGGGSEVIFTYLESLTNDCRDVSLDYKLSGPKLSNLPGPASPATFLSDLKPDANRGKGDILLPKTSCSVFNSTNLDYVLRNLNVEQLLICGQLTDQCVESAVRDGADLGYFVTVAEDACAAKSVEEHSKGLRGMKGFARIMDTDRVLRELREAPKGEGGVVRDGSSASVGAAAVADGTPTAEPIPPSAADADAPAGRRPLGIRSASSWSSSSSGGTDPTEALLRALRFSGVKFLRCATVDACNSLRCKAVPLDRILSSVRDKRGESSAKSTVDVLNSVISFAEVVIAGLPGHADALTPGTGLDARRVLTFRPDVGTTRVLPHATRTAMVMGTLHDQTTGTLSPLCARGLLIRVLDAAEREFGVAFDVGAEIEFNLFRDDTPEPVDRSLFGNSATLDQQEKFVAEVHDRMEGSGVELELVHAESGSGQLEIVLGYRRNAVRLADDVVLVREIIGGTAREHGMRALFLPKVDAAQAGNGMHLHLSFRDSRNADDPDRNAFPRKGAKGLISPEGESFVEGILCRLSSLISLTMPSKNSFRRVAKGCWTGHTASWAIEDKEVPLRVCLDLATGEATNVEMKLSDSTANIYLELATVLSAGLDGMARSLTLRPALIGEAGESEEALPSSLSESLECLRNDSFLRGVMGDELSRGYIALKDAEIERSANMTLEDEVLEAYKKA